MEDITFYLLVGMRLKDIISHWLIGMTVKDINFYLFVGERYSFLLVG
jgi:hypothetical protein